MDNLFKHILDVTGVCGVLCFSREGDVVYRHFKGALQGHDRGLDGNFYAMVRPFLQFQEAELVFEKRKIFIRQSDNGTLFVVMEPMASAAMVRLNCDILIPKLGKQKKAKGFGSFFR